ncbi:hypothetical protein J1N35_038388 [Gossypium stocksii]|uniref:Uncharacterized protein n=1 Tax=Gossypium stocksii TaxID=47602 RepID=A0A9D3UMN1_9ROSI|nr:hypothetical protein J1N35_038388 [Gossypium stocksii]
MSHKRTRSSKTTPENLILIDDEVKERFDSIFKHQPMMPRKGFNLKSNDLMAVPVPLKKIVNALKWKRFCDALSVPNDELVLEFYASLTTQDATELIEKVHELNQSEQEEPTKPDTKESTNETKTEANLVTETEEEEFDKEPGSPRPAEGSTHPELRVEPEEEIVKLSVEPEFTTPMLTSANTSKKSKLSIMMDMCKFMHNQQQTYWKYEKIRDDSIQNTLKNISNTFVPEFPNAIFETWTEDADYASGNEAEEDKGNEPGK